jgi:hypothetical protein
VPRAGLADQMDSYRVDDELSPFDGPSLIHFRGRGVLRQQVHKLRSSWPWVGMFGASIRDRVRRFERDLGQPLVEYEAGNRRKPMTVTPFGVYVVALIRRFVADTRGTADVRGVAAHAE